MTSLLLRVGRLSLCAAARASRGPNEEISFNRVSDAKKYNGRARRLRGKREQTRIYGGMYRVANDCDLRKFAEFIFIG